jgi:hypothetical protein
VRCGATWGVALFSVIAAGFAAFAMAAVTPGEDTSQTGSDARIAQVAAPFPDAHDKPPAGWTGPRVSPQPELSGQPARAGHRAVAPD